MRPGLAVDILEAKAETETLIGYVITTKTRNRTGISQTPQQ